MPDDRPGQPDRHVSHMALERVRRRSRPAPSGEVKPRRGLRGAGNGWLVGTAFPLSSVSRFGPGRPVLNDRPMRRLCTTPFPTRSFVCDRAPHTCSIACRAAAPVLSPLPVRRITTGPSGTQPRRRARRYAAAPSAAVGST